MKRIRNPKKLPVRLAQIRNIIRRRPQTAKGSALFWALMAPYYAYAGVHYKSPAIALLCVLAVICAACWLLGETYLRFIASRAALDLSATLLRLAARVSVAAGAASITKFNAATILGHTSPEDPAEPPVTIAELLDVLDGSLDNRITLEIGVAGGTRTYRIEARKISSIDRFIELNAGREHYMPEPRGWISPLNRSTHTPANS